MGSYCTDECKQTSFFLKDLYNEHQQTLKDVVLMVNPSCKAIDPSLGFSLDSIKSLTNKQFNNFINLVFDTYKTTELNKEKHPQRPLCVNKSPDAIKKYLSELFEKAKYDDGCKRRTIHFCQAIKDALSHVCNPCFEKSTNQNSNSTCPAQLEKATQQTKS